MNAYQKKNNIDLSNLKKTKTRFNSFLRKFQIFRTDPIPETLKEIRLNSYGTLLSDIPYWSHTRVDKSAPYFIID